MSRLCKAQRHAPYANAFERSLQQGVDATHVRRSRIHSGQYGDRARARQTSLCAHAILIHTDESHLHIHYFCVGDAHLMHPGLAAEYQNGKRIECPRERRARYRTAMTQFLDNFHSEVGAKCDLSRRIEATPKPRIKDRAIALRVLDLERRLDERDDAEIRVELAQIRRDAPKAVRSQMRF